MSWKPDIFIYHANCDDGFGAAWAVHQRWGDQVEYVPAHYGQTPPDVAGKNVLIGDYSYKRAGLDQLANSAASVIILDHHKTAREDLAPFTVQTCGSAVFSCADVPGMLRDLAELDRPAVLAYFDMNKCGARLVWEFCHPGRAFPELLRFVEDRDLWTFEHPATKGFSLFLRSHKYDFTVWSGIANALANDGERDTVMIQAAAVEAFYLEQLERILEQTHFETIGGRSVPVVNCPYAFASDAAHQLLQRHPDAAFAASFFVHAGGNRHYSLRSDDEHADVSAVASALGGGGHRNAAGFEARAA